MASDEPMQARFELPLAPSINQPCVPVHGWRALDRASRQDKEAASKAAGDLREAGVVSGSLVVGLKKGFPGLFITASRRPGGATRTDA